MVSSMEGGSGIVARQSTRAQLMPRLDARVRTQTRASVTYHAVHQEQIDERLKELNREWGVERWLQLNSAVLSLAGLALALTRGRPWLALPAVVQGFLLQHGVQGFCPPLIVLRKLGLRTLSEVEAERFALKALRGEFEALAGGADVQATLRKTSQPEGEGAPADSTLKRVPAHTRGKVNESIRRELEQRLELYAAHPELRDARLAELDREWDAVRAIQVEGPLTTLTGILLAWRKDPRWLARPLFAQSMMVLHAVRGSYPMLPLFRRMGMRTEQEISTERYAVKVMRGDFERVPRDEAPAARADVAFEAAQPTH
ncbi:MAG TPA: hypothetical protein VFO83_09290 [Aggregicoccus sp.]|nr:hypothetical protein [Aggregicoccus sp.]